MSDKRTNRVSLFFSDAELAAYSLDADAVNRELHDYIRSLVVERHQQIRESHAATLVARVRESERNREAVDALLRQQVAPTVADMQQALQRQRERRVWDGRDDDGFPRTVSMGDKG